jgi:hypothetical protein
MKDAWSDTGQFGEQVSIFLVYWQCIRLGILEMMNRHRPLSLKIEIVMSMSDGYPKSSYETIQNQKRAVIG